MQKQGFFDNTNYYSEDLADFVGLFFSTGVIEVKGLTDSLKVEENSQTSVRLNSGAAVIKGRYYAFSEEIDDQIILTPDTVTADRTDRVVLQLDLSSGTIRPLIKTGGALLPPSLVRNEITYEIGLAVVKWIKTAGGYRLNTIIDTRGYNDVCGFCAGTFTLSMSDLVDMTVVDGTVTLSQYIDGDISVRRSGPVVSISGTLQAVRTSTGNMGTLFTIPEGFRPSTAIRSYMSTNNYTSLSSVVAITVNPDGECKLSGQSLPANSPQYLLNVTYIADGILISDSGEDERILEIVRSALDEAVHAGNGLNLGLVRVQSGSGLYLNNGWLQGNNVADKTTGISNRSSNWLLNASQTNAIVKGALTDTNRISDLTDVEKANAKEVLGITDPIPLLTGTDDDPVIFDYVENTENHPIADGVYVVNGSYEILAGHTAHTVSNGLLTIATTNRVTRGAIKSGAKIYMFEISGDFVEEKTLDLWDLAEE